MDCTENPVYMHVLEEEFLICFQTKVHQCGVPPAFFLFCFVVDLGCCLPTFSA